MRRMLSKLWKDEDGIVAFEYLLVATVVGLTLVVGLSIVATALNVEFSELANAILSLNQGYAIAAQSNCVAVKDGVDTGLDTPGTTSFGSSGVRGADISTPAVLNLNACP